MIIRRRREMWFMKQQGPIKTQTWKPAHVAHSPGPAYTPNTHVRFIFKERLTELFLITISLSFSPGCKMSLYSLYSTGSCGQTPIFLSVQIWLCKSFFFSLLRTYLSVTWVWQHTHSASCSHCGRDEHRETQTASSWYPDKILSKMGLPGVIHSLWQCFSQRRGLYSEDSRRRHTLNIL